MNVLKTPVRMGQHAPTLKEATGVHVTVDLLERTVIKVSRLNKLKRFTIIDNRPHKLKIRL